MSAAASLRPSPGRDVLDLTNALARAGWGEVLSRPDHRAARFVLRELANLSYDAHQGRQGTATTTAPQLARLTGYCERQTREGLYALEDLGIIEWHRGGIREGRPTPSVIRIVKTVLADLVEAARTWCDARISERAVATMDRIKRTVRYRLCRGRKRAREAHAAATASLPLFEGRKGARASRPSAPKPTVPPKEKQPMRHEPEYMRYLATTCTHGGLAPDRCNRCKYEAIQRLERVKEATKIKAERQAYEEAREVPWEELYPRAYVEYMKAKHPGTNHHSWPRLQLNDPRAKELLLNG